MVRDGFDLYIYSLWAEVWMLTMPLMCTRIKICTDKYGKQNVFLCEWATENHCRLYIVWLVSLNLQHTDLVWVGTEQLEYKHYLSFPSGSYRTAVNPFAGKSGGSLSHSSASALTVMHSWAVHHKYHFLFRRPPNRSTILKQKINIHAVTS